MYERNLPPYLAHDLEAWKKGVEEKSHLLDCLLGELYGSINIANTCGGKDVRRRFCKTYLEVRYEALFGEDR